MKLLGRFKQCIALFLCVAFAATSISRTSSTSSCNADQQISSSACMKCCSGMTPCKMPKQAALCSCNSLLESPTACVSAIDFFTPAAIIESPELIVVDQPIIQKSNQKILSECDLPPPEHWFGQLPNRAPPSA